MMQVEQLITNEVNMYLDYCRKAAAHDENEQAYRSLAHVIFYHIQEMRTTGKPTFLANSI